MQIKFKLAHAKGKSFFIVDGLIDDTASDWRWYLPLFFSPPMLVFVSEKDATARLSVDLLGGGRADVVFAKQDAIATLPDGSFLSRCDLENPDALERAESVGCRCDSGLLDLQLFHHTTSVARDRILASEQFWLSAWNIQGTRRLANIGYLYLTSKPQIRTEQDLADIAMASSGRLYFLPDGGHPSKDVIALTVYRASTLDRTAALPVSLPAHRVSTQPLLFHPDAPGNPAYYEVIQPAIFRVGAEPSEVFPYRNGVLGPSGRDKAFSYAVVGNAATAYGIAAPYDEECTTSLAQIEASTAGQDVFAVWYALQNSPRFNPEALERATFLPP